MSIESVIPALWSARLLTNLNNEHVYASCANRDYEGEIKGMGSSVKINSIGRITIRDFTRNTDITAAETLDTAGQYLVINKGSYFNFQIDDVDKAQANVSLMDAAMEEASWGLKEAVDDYLAAQFVANVPSSQTLTAATIGRGPGERSMYDVLLDLDIKLTEQNTPRGGRWAVVPPWGEGMLRADNNFVGFGTGDNKGALRGSPIGTAAGFTVYVSNNVPTSGSAHQIVAGYKGAATYAEQVTEQMAYKPERRFAQDAMKGLLVYGFKVTRPANLAMILGTRGT